MSYYQNEANKKGDSKDNTNASYYREYAIEPFQPIEICGGTLDTSPIIQASN